MLWKIIPAISLFTLAFAWHTSCAQQIADTGSVLNDDMGISSTRGISQVAYPTFGKGRVVAFG